MTSSCFKYHNRFLTQFLVHDHDSDDSDSDTDSTKKRSIIDSKIPSKIRDLKFTRRERVFGGPLKDAVKSRQQKVPFGKLML